MPRLELFPFRYRNAVTGKWVARGTWLLGRRSPGPKPNGRSSVRLRCEMFDPGARYFTSFRRVAPHAEAMRIEQMGLSEVAFAAGDAPRNVLHFPPDCGPRRLGQIGPHLCGVNSDFRMLGHAPGEVV